MKLLSNVFVTEVNGQYVAVATGKAAQKFSGMVQMNGTAAFVVEQLHNQTTEEQLVEALMREYEVGAEDARRNVDGILQTLRKTGWLDE